MMFNVMSTRRIYIETTTKCNLKCPFCPYPYQSLTDKGQIEFELIKDLVDDIVNNVPYRILYFHNIGEPFLYGEIKELFRLCGCQKVNFGITTNGLLMHKYIGDLCENSPSQINISLQTIDESLHSRRGINCSVDDYLSLLSRSIEGLNSLGYKGQIKLKLMVGKKQKFKGEEINPINSQEDFIISVEKVSQQVYKRRMDARQLLKLKKIDWKRHCKIEIKRDMFIETFPFLTWGNYGKSVKKTKIGSCDGVLGQLLIRSNGDVGPCCYDFEGEIVFGNIHLNKLSEILASKKVENFKRELAYKNLIESRCMHCQGSEEGQTTMEEEQHSKEERFAMSNNIVSLVTD